MSLIDKIQSMLIKPKKCSVCQMDINFSIVFGYAIDKNLNAKTQKRFCIAHGLDELRRLLSAYQGKILVAEPDDDPISGLFFYGVHDLKTHDYSDEDKDQVEQLLSKLEPPASEVNLGWLPKDVIGCCADKPLIKKSPPALEPVSASEAAARLNRILHGIEQKFHKGEFWITEPRGEQGIYIWDGNV